ncbi:hypothetical protein EVAR_49922_1 [Eumeta japonica]|uniref:Uncharacterized protein n=1 Tax=Eumeta variegata TaxID=151549 RepID=A0A4C1Y2C5_EUMVA|nr:hypothetical protein EVAR_49922_1 [Eumeta japonica]
MSEYLDEKNPWDLTDRLSGFSSVVGPLLDAGRPRASAPRPLLTVRTAHKSPLHGLLFNAPFELRQDVQLRRAICKESG